MVPSHSQLEEIAARAETLYEQQIRPLVEVNNIGKYLVIEIESGSYKMDTDEITAMKRAAARYPGGKFHILRIGYPALVRIGVRMTGRGA
jgi:hypothetical protein